MKRLLLAACVLAFLIAGYRFITWDPSAPKFERVRSFKVPTYTSLSYEFLASRPFVGGKMWIALHNSTNWWGSYLFDIERREVIGELRSAWPVLLNRDGTQLLCMRRGPDKSSLLLKGRLLIEQFIGRRFLPWRPMAPRADDIETFWLLDLSSNRTTPLGEISQFRGAGSSFRPSPDFRFAFNISTASRDSLLVCDLDNKASKVMNLAKDAWPAGWWDKQNILLLNQTNDFLLLDVVSERTSLLLAGTNVLAFLDQNHVDHQGQRPTPFLEWNGREYECYVADTHRKWQATNSFLLKLQRPDAGLTLVAPDFKFEWSDHLDAQRHYVYSGRERGQGSDGVFLRDLEAKTEKTLVEPNNANFHSVPNFYGPNVIYVRSNQLWSIDFNGSNNVRLFPPTQ
jgi:hypothetical protein